MDAVTQARLPGLHPELIKRFTELDAQLEADPLKIILRVTQGVRTWSQQDALFAKGRTVPGPVCMHGGKQFQIGSCPQHPLGLVVTKARGGYSAHNFCYAIDAEPNDPDFPKWNPDESTQDERWKVFLAKAKDCGLAEGAEWRSFPDFPHLYLKELPPTPDDNMRYIFKEGGMSAVWEDWVTRYSLPLQ